MQLLKKLQRCFKPLKFVFAIQKHLNIISIEVIYYFIFRDQYTERKNWFFFFIPEGIQHSSYVPERVSCWNHDMVNVVMHNMPWLIFDRNDDKLTLKMSHGNSYNIVLCQKNKQFIIQRL